MSKFVQSLLKDGKEKNFVKTNEHVRLQNSYVCNYAYFWKITLTSILNCDERRTI